MDLSVPHNCWWRRGDFTALSHLYRPCVPRRRAFLGWDCLEFDACTEAPAVKQLRQADGTLQQKGRAVSRALPGSVKRLQPHKPHHGAELVPLPAPENSVLRHRRGTPALNGVQGREEGAEALPRAPGTILGLRDPQELLGCPTGEGKAQHLPSHGTNLEPWQVLCVRTSGLCSSLLRFLKEPQEGHEPPPSPSPGCCRNGRRRERQKIKVQGNF